MNRQLYLVLSVVVLSTLLLSACGGGGKTVQSSLQRVMAPQVAPAASQELVNGNNAFAFDLYQAAQETKDNLIFSPYSVSLAFAMTYAGARGETARQMKQVLHYTLPEEQLHPAFNALDLDLARRPEEAAAAGLEKKDIFQLSIANSLWGQEDWPFLPEYLDLLALNYGAGLRLVDFVGAPESARRQINDWVSDQTKKRIQNIVPPGAIDSLTRLVLANAIYFKATWQFEFDANKTEDRPFYLLNGQAVNVPMMSIGDPKPFAYAAGDGWQAIALPYKGKLAEMVIIVPDAGNFEAFESTLTADRYNEVLSAMEVQQVLLFMPKFKFETELGLKSLLIGMGMEDAFDPALADFSGMDGQHDLYIGNALHKAFVAVDEKGTEAAAATVVLMAMSAMPLQGVELTIDRPFFYLIRDVPTGTILFMGRVLDPRGE